MPKSRSDIGTQALRLYEKAEGNPSRQKRIMSILERYYDNISRTPEDRKNAREAEVARGDVHAYYDLWGQDNPNFVKRLIEADEKASNTKYPRSVYAQASQQRQEEAQKDAETSSKVRTP